jgi:O-glycosyl hydrolase
LFFIHRPAFEESLLYVYFDADGTLQRYEPSPYGYAIAHFAREVVPGSVRVEAGGTDPLVRASAFQRPDGQLVLVLINNHDTGVNVTLSVRGPAGTAAQFSPRVSTAVRMWQVGDNLRMNDGLLDLSLPARSITTLAPA